MNLEKINFNEPNIKLACEILSRRYLEGNQSIFNDIVKDYPNWVGTGAEEYLSNKVYAYFNGDFKKTVEQLIQPISERLEEGKFFVSYHNDSAQTPFYANFGYKPVYVYVHSEVEGRFGKQFLVACNCDNDLVYTYSRKQINETFKVGHFYKIALEGIREFGKGYKKYCYEIEEIDEETYIQKGVFTRSHLG